MAEDVKIKISDADLYGTDALGRWESRRAKMREARRRQWVAKLAAAQSAGHIRISGIEDAERAMEAAKDRIEAKRKRRDDFWD